MSEQQLNLDACRSLAEFEAASAVESRSKLIDEHNSAFRWMVASLFALNGGAILSIFGRADFGSEPVFPAFWIFFGGIISTFFTVILAQMSDRQMIAHMHQWGLYWTAVRVTGIRIDKNEKSIRLGILKAAEWGNRARLLAIFAMIWFVLGVLGAAVLKQKSEVARLELKLDQIEAATPKP